MKVTGSLPYSLARRARIPEDGAEANPAKRRSAARSAPAEGIGVVEPGWGPGRARSPRKLAAPIVISARTIQILPYLVALFILLPQPSTTPRALAGQAARRRHLRECR